MSNPRLKNREKSYVSSNRVINKSREDFMNQLFNYAKSNFADQIEDFSDASLGGMLLDFAAVVGESLSFYVEQQFNELDYQTATSEYSLINHLRKAGVTSDNSSPASAYVTFYIEVDVDTTNTKEIVPLNSQLPIIKKETSLSSNSGIKFVLEEDVDFNKSYDKITTSEFDNNGNPIKVILEKQGLCVSGEIVSESFQFDSDPDANFLSYTLSNDDVTKIIKIQDEEQNEYFEVEYLTQNTVYIKNTQDKTDFFEVKPAPFRYIVENNFDSGFTLIRFGNGKGKELEEGILTNPEELSLPILGRDYVRRNSLDPKDLLSSDSLGISPAGKLVTFKYKFGSGTSHNVPAGSIETIDNLIIIFPNSDDQSNVNNLIVSNSAAAYNLEAAVGGSDGLTFEELRNQIPIALKKQSRIVNHEDLLSRIYTMPTDFGRIHKAAIIENPFTKISKDLYIICKDSDDKYVYANDALKVNLSKFINEYRLIGDTFNVIDAPIFNFSIFLKIKVSSNYSVRDVLAQVSSRIFQQMRFETFQIGQGINVNDIISIALNIPGVLTINSNFKNIIRSVTTTIANNGSSYSDNIFSAYENYEDGIVYPPRGGIFELKYPELDIEIINS